MNTRAASIVAWSIVGATIALHAASGVFVFLGRHVTTPADKDISSFGALGFLLAFLAFPVVGAAVVSRRPGNAIGWLFLFIGVDFAISDIASRYADYALFADPGSLPGGVWVGWLSGWLDPVVFAAIMLVLLLFPDGAPLTRRWRPVVWFVGAVVVLGVLWNALKPDQIFTDSLPVENPAGVGWLGDNLAFLDTVVFLGFAAGAILSVVAAVVRYRRSKGIERDQMKWLAFAALLLFAGFLGAIVFSLAALTPLADFVIGLGFAAVPVAVGIGVLRYRLYEIDRVISRTVSFALVTAALGAAYVGLVLLGQSAVLVRCRRGRPRRRRVDARGGSALPTRAFTRAAIRRPPLQPAPLRRAKTLEAFGLAPARAGRARAALGRSRRGRHGDDAAEPHHALGEAQVRQ